jgi:hypothetical protein
MDTNNYNMSQRNSGRLARGNALSLGEGMMLTALLVDGRKGLHLAPSLLWHAKINRKRGTGMHMSLRTGTLFHLAPEACKVNIFIWYQ